MSRFRCWYNLDLARQVVYPPRSDATEERIRLASFSLAWSTTSVQRTSERTVVTRSQADNGKSLLALSFVIIIYTYQRYYFIFFKGLL